MIKLDIGCGRRKEEGYIGLDIGSKPNIDAIEDIRALPFKNHIADEIKCIHVLEHLNEDAWQGYYEISQAVAEFARVLKPSGKVIIEVPSPQSEDAVRGGHKTVYGHYRLNFIFSNYFDDIEAKRLGTWIQIRFVSIIFSVLASVIPFFGNHTNLR